MTRRSVLAGVALMFSSRISAANAGPAIRPQRFTGKSRSGIDSAVANAVAAAEKTATHSDALVEWSLERVTGKYGGIVGFSDVTVTISAVVR